MDRLKTVQMIRSDRRTLSVGVDLFGRVTVRAPKNCGEARIIAFLKDKEAWITARVKQAEANASRLPKEDLDGFRFLLLGRECTIALTDGKRVSFDEAAYTVYLPRERAKERLVKWLKENAKRIFAQTTERIAREMGVRYKSVSVSSATTRWGSCSGENAVRYSFRLLYAPKEVIEYVVIHELAHVKQKNHSRAFWAVVERYCPNWRPLRKWLKENVVLTRIF